MGKYNTTVLSTQCGDKEETEVFITEISWKIILTYAYTSIHYYQYSAITERTNAWRNYHQTALLQN